VHRAIFDLKRVSRNISAVAENNYMELRQRKRLVSHCNYRW